MQLMERQRMTHLLSNSFSRRLGEFIDESTRRQLASPGLEGADPELQKALAAATAHGAALLVQALRSAAEPANQKVEFGAPFAQVAARHGIPLAAVLQCYRISHATAVDHLLDCAEEEGITLGIAVEPMRNLFWHMDSMVAIGSRIYVAERRRINSRPERAKYLRIQAVLDGGTELGLPYPLEGHHVAVVLRSPQPAAVLAAVAEAAGRAPLLVTEAPDGKVLAWISCKLCEEDVVAALRANASGPLAAGVSGHEPGIEGFRAAHRKAGLALKIGSSQGQAVTTFADVALEALAVGGPDVAWEFVRSEIGALTDPGRRTSLLRATLSEYFAARGALAAAERLGVSERTVTYRLRHAEEILGRPLSVRRAELETALRLHRLLTGAGQAAA
jgi:nucleotide-binding universal stress UspA family protein